jgi:hypothetical protein
MQGYVEGLNGLLSAFVARILPSSAEQMEYLIVFNMLHIRNDTMVAVLDCC